MAKLVDDKTLKVPNLSAIEIERIEPLDIMGLLRSLWYGKSLIAGCTILALVAAAYYAFAIAQPRFAAVTTLKIETTFSPGLDLDQALANPPTDQSSLNTEVAVLRSRHLLERMVHELDLTNDPAFNRYLTPIAPWSVTGMRTRARNILSGTVAAPPDDAAILDKTVDNLAAALSVDKLRDTYVFRITATTGDADVSAGIADTLARLYLADQVAAKQAATETAFNWLSDRVYALQLELEAKETAVNDIIMANRASDAATLDTLSRQSIEAQERLLDIRRALQEAEVKLTSFDAAVTPASQPARQRVLADIRHYTDQAAALETFQSGVNSQLAAQSASMVRLQQLRREAEATRVLYEAFLARLQHTNVQRGLGQADSRILALAAPGKYVAPRKMLILLIAAMLGMALGVTLVLGRQAMRKGFSCADGLADATNVPVLAQIPRVKLRKPAALLDYLNAKPTSTLAEAMRNLRTSLLLADPGKVPQVILSTSSVPGEGKTTQSIALAHNLASLGKSVLLVEADMRQPSFGSYLQCQGGDLGQVVTREIRFEDAIARDPRLSADVLSSHAMRHYPADLFAGPGFAAFVDQVRERYDFIVIDAPPVLPAPDTRLLAQHADAVLYAVRWERTDKRLVLAGQRALADILAPITGMVLGQVDIRRMRRYGAVPMAAYGQPYYQN